MMELQEVFSEFDEYVESSAPKLEGYHPHLGQAFWEMLLHGGKRFRPKLFLAVAHAHAPLLVPSSLRVALAIEVLHTYSLIHDDLPVMDDADLRRGHPTLHVQYDEVTATLVGDGLNTYAFYLISQAALDAKVRIDLVAELAKYGGIDGMVLGQALDCHFEGQRLSFEELKTLHLNKTAKLIAASLKMGAITCGLPPAVQEELFGFGLDLGLMFQIQDDIIDVTESDAEAGKSTGVDAEKNSYVNLLGLEGAIQRRDELILSLQSRLENQGETLQKNLSQLLQKYFHLLG